MTKKLRRSQAAAKLTELVTPQRSLSALLQRAQDGDLRLSILASATARAPAFITGVWTPFFRYSEVESTEASLHIVEFPPVRETVDATWRPPNGALVRLLEWTGDLRELATRHQVSVTKLLYSGTDADTALVRALPRARARRQPPIPLPDGVELPRAIHFVGTFPDAVFRIGIDDVFVSEREGLRSGLMAPIKGSSKKHDSSADAPGWKRGHTPAEKEREVREMAAEALWNGDEPTSHCWLNGAPNRAGIARYIADVKLAEAGDASIMRSTDDEGREGAEYAKGWSEATVRNILKKVVFFDFELRPPSARNGPPR